MRNSFPVWLALASLLIALIGGGLMLASGVGHRLDLLHFRSALSVFRWAGVLGLVTTGLAAISLFLTFFKEGGVMMLISLVSLVLGLTVATPAYLFKWKAASVPKIHDITTDTENPPRLVKAYELRGRETNSLEYGGNKVAAQQREAYPDVQPKVLDLPKKRLSQKLWRRWKSWVGK